MYCYLCGSSNFENRPGSVRDNDQVKVLECSECGLVFLDNDKHINENFYENSGMHDENPDYKKWLLDCKRDDYRRLNTFQEKITNKVCPISG